MFVIDFYLFVEDTLYSDSFVSNSSSSGPDDNEIEDSVYILNKVKFNYKDLLFFFGDFICGIKFHSSKELSLLPA